MAYFFGDSFDCYALPADALLGYWDSGNVGASGVLVSGRFAGSRALQASVGSTTTAVLQKTSGSNDSVHHLVLSYMQTTAITGSTNYFWFTLMDGSTAQCSVMFRSDGAILFYGGAAGGTLLATYTGAVTAASVWYAFEIEIVVNNTTGSVAVRKNGNTANDFSATSLNTRGGTANNYANTLKFGNAASSLAQNLDDLLWRSDAASVPWVGDIRCYTRRPDTDAAAAWSRPSTFQMQPYFGTTSNAATAATAKFTPFISQGGTIGSVVVNLTAGSAGNVKCAIFTASAGQPATVLQAASATIASPISGSNTFTFSPPVSIAKGTQFFVGVCHDTNIASGYASAFTAPYTTTGFSSTQAYGTFPASSPAGLSATAAWPFFPVVTPAANADAVSEPYEDAAASYVYSSTVGQADLYTLTGIDSTPTSIIGVTTRALAQKSDAGTRNVAVQLKSGATTVESASAALNTTWGHIYRVDTVDPATSAAWTPTAVNNLQIGAVVKA